MGRQQNEYPKTAGRTKISRNTGFSALIGLKIRLLPLGLFNLSSTSAARIYEL